MRLGKVCDLAVWPPQVTPARVTPIQPLHDSAAAGSDAGTWNGTCMRAYVVCMHACQRTLKPWLCSPAQPSRAQEYRKVPPPTCSTTKLPTKSKMHALTACTQQAACMIGALQRTPYLPLCTMQQVCVCKLPLAGTPHTSARDAALLHPTVLHWAAGHQERMRVGMPIDSALPGSTGAASMDNPTATPAAR